MKLKKLWSGHKRSSGSFFDIEKAYDAMERRSTNLRRDLVLVGDYNWVLAA
jgi:hypothetical protein